MLHVSRHGAGHVRLSNHVTHRANIAALAAPAPAGVLAVTVCGAVDPSVPLGSLICFDDLHFPSNRLPDGALCTFFAEAGDPRRGHWIYEAPFSPPLRRALLAGAAEAGAAMRDGGCYGHVDGPRFNTRAEIRGLAAVGVTAVSQTAGPETVLAGEAELPFALVGYATDYANGVQAEPTPVARLLELIAASTETLRAAVRRDAAADRRGGAGAAPASCTASTTRDRAVVAEAPGPGCLPGLAPLLGAERARALQRLLVARAAAWARRRGAGRAVLALAGEPPDGAGGRAAGRRRDARGRCAAAGRRRAARRPRTAALLGGRGVAAAGPEHAAAALSTSPRVPGSVFGPALDGGAYSSPAPRRRAGPAAAVGRAAAAGRGRAARGTRSRRALLERATAGSARARARSPRALRGRPRADVGGVAADPLAAEPRAGSPRAAPRTDRASARAARSRRVPRRRSSARSACAGARRRAPPTETPS